MKFLANKIRELLFCHRDEWFTESPVTSPLQRHMGGKTENCRGRHSIAVFFLQKVFSAELWRRMVEGGRLPKPLAVHQTLVRGICVKDRKCHPISKMCRHCSSRQPLLQEPCTPPTTPAGPSSH